MIRLSIYYPTTDGARFDHDYYATTHVPRAVAAWSPAGADIERGIDGPYVAAAHFTFESMDVMRAAFAAPDTPGIQADVANYTDIEPVRQISEVVTPA